MPVISQIVPDVGVIPFEARLLRLQAEIANIYAAGSEATVHLFKAGEVSVLPFTTAAAYQAAEADYSGYAAGVLAPPIPQVSEEEDLSYQVTIPSMSFNHSGGGVANDIGGWWLQDDNGAVIRAAAFETPVEMANALDTLTLIITIRESSE